MSNPTVIINLEPDWGYTPEISYAFETVIQPTPYFVEQRRPLLPTPVRIQGCRYAFSGKSLQYARNLFLYGLSKLCCIPIYSEPVFSAAVTQGATSITATTDLTYLWNIKNSDWLILLDFVSGQSEMLRISSVAGQVINLSSAIVNSWTASRTIIFPAFAGTISKVKGMDTTDRVGRVDVEFEEQAIGEEATKYWVGLDEQVCFGTPSTFVSWLDMSYGNYAAFENVAGYGDVLHLNAWSQIYVGSFGANAEANHIFNRVGRLQVAFDYYHGEDYWYDDDFTDSQFWLGIYPEAYTVLTDFWQYGTPSATAAIMLKLRKLSTARVSLVTSNLGLIANPTLTGLSSGLYASNHYDMEIDWSAHTISVWVNSVLVISAVSFGTGLDSLFGTTFKVLFHQQSYSYTFAHRYIKSFRITL